MDESNHPCDEDLENADVNATVENESYAETSFSTALEHRKLKLELETCKQELYLLRRKFELREAIHNDLQMTKESLERQLSKKSSSKDNAFRELEEQYRAKREDYEERITSLETALSERVSQNEELQELLAKQREEAASVAASEASIATDNNDTTALEQQIELLMQHLQEEANLRQNVEKALDHSKIRYSELQNVLEATREHLREKSETLEGAREELALLRAEMNAAKPVLDAGSSKGNSLFAEVEDRRKQTVDKFAALKAKYIEAKQLTKTTCDENKMLRAKLATLVKKWENSFIDNRADNEELIKIYKSRLAVLEEKLRLEMKKNEESPEPAIVNPSYESLQLLLTSKKREVQSLELKIEDLSMKLFIKEEASLNTEKQLRFWKYKASSLEAQTMLSKTAEEVPDTPNVNAEVASGRDVLSPIENDNISNVKCVKDNPRDCSNDDTTGLKKSLRFSEDTKDNASCLKKTKSQEYPMIYIPG